MLLNFTLGCVIAAVLGLGFAWLVFKLFRKVFKRKAVTSGFWAFFFGALAATGIIMMNGRALIVKSQTEQSFYMVYGSPDYMLQNGKTISVSVPIQNCMVINDSKEELIIEAVVYGYASQAQLDKIEDVLVAPNEAKTIQAMSMAYLFGERPPKTIENKNNSGDTYKIKYWLRTVAAYEADYGAIDGHEDEMTEEDVTEAENGDETADESLDEAAE